MQVDDAKRLKALEAANAKLKKLLAESIRTDQGPEFTGGRWTSGHITMACS